MHSFGHAYLNDEDTLRRELTRALGSVRSFVVSLGCLNTAVTART
jgi:hypothetical protein